MIDRMTQNPPCIIMLGCNGPAVDSAEWSTETDKMVPQPPPPTCGIQACGGPTGRRCTETKAFSGARMTMMYAPLIAGCAMFGPATDVQERLAEKTSINPECCCCYPMIQQADASLVSRREHLLHNYPGTSTPRDS